MFSFQVKAEPGQVEFIFLSQPKSNALLNLINKPQIMSKWNVRNTNDVECVPMGEGCFHPQLGYLDEIPDNQKNVLQNIKKEKKVVEKDSASGKSKTINSLETNLINCDKNASYFDIFCGKAKGGVEYGGPVEVWIDTSSSMRLIDYSKDHEYCERRHFAAQVAEGCNKKVTISGFDTGKRIVGDLSGLCINRGTNNGKKLVEWIKASKAKHLIVVTDVEEYGGALRAYIDLQSYKIHGIGVKPLDHKTLTGFSPIIEKTCRKL
jgi:hypothetical protein